MKKSSKKKYNLLFAIQDMKLDKAFEDYKKCLNPSISENRKAKAFLTHFARVIGPYKLECYEVGKERPRYTAAEELAQLAIVNFNLWND